MSVAWKEGDVVALIFKKSIREFGVMIATHPRGECELSLGLALLESGRFIPLSSSWTKTVEGCSLSLISLSNIPKRCSPVLVHFLERGGNPIRKRGRPRLPRLDRYSVVTGELFHKWGSDKRPFLGELRLPREFKSLSSLVKEIEIKEFIMKRRKNDEFLKETSLRKLLEKALKGESEGFWMNPCVSVACIKYFGIPAEYFDTGRKLVSEYNQIIFQVDGSDCARTLGMHKDRDSENKEVNTILGCVAGDGGKDIILWKESMAGNMPRWWRNEGLSREAFQLAKIQCQIELSDKVDMISLNPGEFVFMPKGTWHWACPSAGTSWTVMVTSSFY